MHPTSLTTLTVDAPGQLLATHVVAGEQEALALLRDLCPPQPDSVPDDDLVHALGEQGVRVQILAHDVSHLLPGLLPEVPADQQHGAAAWPPRSPYGDLFRYDSFAVSADERLGQYMRPATAMEAAYSRSSARHDGGLGVFGVHATGPGGASPGGPTIWLESRPTFIHNGSRAWEQALLTSRVRYYRVGAIPDTTVLPPLPRREMPVPGESDPF